MFARRVYNIFISHSWENDSNFNLLMDELKASWFFSFENFSITSQNPLACEGRELKRELARLVRQADVVLFTNDPMAVINADRSEWIRHEISVARNFFKPIILVKRPGVSAAAGYIGDVAHSVVSLDQGRIAGAIRKMAKYSAKMPETFADLADVMERLFQFYDSEEAKEWLGEPRPELGGMPAAVAITLGEKARVLDLIDRLEADGCL